MLNYEKYVRKNLYVRLLNDEIRLKINEQIIPQHAYEKRSDGKILWTFATSFPPSKTEFHEDSEFCFEPRVRDLRAEEI